MKEFDFPDPYLHVGDLCFSVFFKLLKHKIYTSVYPIVLFVAKKKRERGSIEASTRLHNGSR